ncbi:MAG: magnesium transporter [Acidimicrobiales bacterium]|jgi:magnesium transporter
MITHYFKTLKDSELKELDTVRTGVWTHVVAPSEEELEKVIGEYGLDEAIVADIRDFFEVPRMEKSGGATYFFTRYPFDEKDEDIDTAPLLVIMGESYVVTISIREVPQFKAFISGEIEVQTTQKAKFFIQIMDTLTKSYEYELTRLRKAVHSDRARLRKIGNREIEKLVNYEHELNDMIASVVPTNAWLQQVTSGNYMQLFHEDVELMEDLMIANSQLVDSARSVLKTIQNIRTATEAILTNKLNATIQTLTILTIILTIPTVIASLYGMNVPLPLEGNPLAFWMILVFIVIVVSSVVLVFKRSEWI